MECWWCFSSMSGHSYRDISYCSQYYDWKCIIKITVHMYIYICMHVYMFLCAHAHTHTYIYFILFYITFYYIIYINHIARYKLLQVLMMMMTTISWTLQLYESSLLKPSLGSLFAPIRCHVTSKNVKNCDVLDKQGYARIRFSSFFQIPAVCS